MLELRQIDTPDDSDIAEWVARNPHIEPTSMERGYVRIGLLTLAFLGVCVLLAWLGVIA